MQLPRLNTLRWMAAVGAAEAIFVVIYGFCCDGELWGYIVLGSLLLSLVAPILLVGLSNEAAGRVTSCALRTLIPTLVVSSISLAAQGDRGFLSNSQGVLTGCIFLILSVGLGYLLACLRCAFSGRDQKGLAGARSDPVNGLEPMVKRHGSG